VALSPEESDTMSDDIREWRLRCEARMRVCASHLQIPTESDSLREVLQIFASFSFRAA
jgi:hypothetical protein